MKKIFIVTAMVMTSIFFGSQDIFAQGQQGQVRLRGALVFGTEIESIGIQVGGDYAITDNILFAPDFIYFFPDSDFGIDVNWFDINLNANYLFEVSNPDVVPYALAGFNIAIISVDFGGITGFSDANDTEVGFNLGGGADFLVGAVVVFGEIRYALGNDQLVLGGGVKIPIN